MKTPVLLIIFNRPETTKAVFNTIREAKPEKLYIAADGPRNDVLSDHESCNEARLIAMSVDWKCEIHKLLRDENVGCNAAVINAVSWFFEHEQYGVILEDDCEPSISFFEFCEEMLIKYKHNKSIGMISACNFDSGLTTHSYKFSKICHIWGWATWGDRWHEFEKHKGSWNTFSRVKSNSIFLKDFIRRQQFKNLRWASLRGYTSWDWNVFFFMNETEKLSIHPQKNMIKNLGFGSNATTSTGKEPQFLLERTAQDISFPLFHPEKIGFSNLEDRETLDRIYKTTIIEKIRILVFSTPMVGKFIKVFFRNLHK